MGRMGREAERFWIVDWGLPIGAGEGKYGGTRAACPTIRRRHGDIVMNGAARYLKDRHGALQYEDRPVTVAALQDHSL
jgi:hypothetical protein